MPKTKLQLDQAVAAQIEAKVKRIAELERCLRAIRNDTNIALRSVYIIDAYALLHSIDFRITRALGKEK